MKLFTLALPKKIFLFLMINLILSFTAVSLIAGPAEYQTVSDWGSGFTGKITVANTTASAFDGWKLEFDFPYTINSIWNAQIISHSGNHYIIENASWNGNVASGNSVEFGFNGSPGNVTQGITNVKLNGNEQENENNPPIAVNDSVTTASNTPITINILDNDSDPDGDTISLVSVTTPGKGQAVIFSSTSVKYTPNTDFTGIDNFNYTIKDSEGSTATATVSVTVTGGNTPETPGFEYSVTSDWGSGFNGQITITNTTGSSSNGWTVEFDYPYTISSIWNASIKSHSGTHYIIENLSWNSILSSGQSTSFGFGATPGNATVEPSNVVINMNNEDEPELPIANNDTSTVEAGESVTIYALSNDTGIDIAITSVTSPTHGTVTFTYGEVSYTAESDYSGTDNFQYTIKDSNGNQATGTITITVTAPETLTAKDDSGTTYINTAKEIDVLANDTGNNISISSVTQPSKGTTLINGGKIKYTPNNDITGTDSFEYTVKDSDGNTATASVMLTIIAKSTLSKVIVGYWHNWTDTTSGIQLKNVPSEYNVIDIAFAEPVSTSDMTMQFNLDTNIQSEESFIQDIQNIQAQGRKVLISIGGANAYIRLNTETDRNNFANSMIAIIEKYGFDGIDIDFEGGAFSITNSSSFKNPTSPLLVNAINAVKTIVSHFKNQGKDFWLTAAPETYYLQAGISAYGGTAGSYIPFLYALKDDLTFVAPQLYNSGSMIGLDGKAYTVGTPNFIVAMTEMLIKGFKVSGTSETFMLDASQIVVGLPATSNAAGSGYQSTENVLNALNYLIKGESFGGSYQLQNSSGYSDMRGIMTWSINWDYTNSYEFATTYYNYFYNNDTDNIAPVIDFVSPINGNEITMSSLSPITISVESSDEDGYISETAISVEGNTYPGLTTNWTPSAFGTYTITSTTKDNEGKTTSCSIQVTVKQSGGVDTNITPTVSFSDPANNEIIKQTALSSINISISASDEDGYIASSVIEINGQTFSGTRANWTPNDFGEYTISATVVDDDGASAVASISITVQQTAVNTTKKQIIGYFTQWDAWKSTSCGFSVQGVCNQLNVDYSKYTILNFSFFGVANDGSLHSADLRNKNIYLEDEIQKPASLLYGDVYSSWDYWLLYGELNLLWSATDEATAAGYIIDGNTWTNTKTGLTGQMPIPMPKDGGAPGLIQLCKDNNVKLVASIGGWSMCKHFPEMAADPTKKANFLKDCKTLIEMGFDGIDIDWEYPGPYSGMNFTGTEADYANFTALMRDIRNTIGSDKILTAAFSCSPEKLANLEWNKLDQYMNYYNIMSYDMNGGWSDYTAHNSPLYAAEGKLSWNNTFKYLTQEKGVSPEKINMGVGFYGRGVITSGDAYLGAPTSKSQRSVQPDGPITTAADYTNWSSYDGTPFYGYIKQNETGWTYNWDDTAKVPYLTKGSYFLSYDDETSIQLKADYVVDNNLGGVIIWNVFGDWEVGNIDTTYGNKLPYCSSINTPLLNILYHTFDTNGEASHL